MREHLTRLGARAQHRGLGAGADHGDRDDDLVRPGEVAADHAGPDQGALVGEAAGEVEGPLGRQVAGRGRGRW